MLSNFHERTTMKLILADLKLAIEYELLKHQHRRVYKAMKSNTQSNLPIMNLNEDKCFLQILVKLINSRIKYSKLSSKSFLAQHYKLIILDDHPTNFIVCIHCKTVLKFVSIDRSHSALHHHYQRCKDNPIKTS